jgi:acetylornithine deacetylase
VDSRTRSIVDAVEGASDRIAETLRDLIRFESVVKADPREAGPGERLCQEYLQGRLTELGFSTDLWEPDGPALYAEYQGHPGAQKGRTFEGRPNLAGTLKGSGGGRSILLTGHIDVVPPGASDHWTHPPFAGVVDDGRVYGRGAVDMKGGVACMLLAVEVLQGLGVPLRGDIVFSTVVDEEIGGMGTLAMVDRGVRADAGILPEPTNAAVSPLCHGILWGRIIVDGIGGHAELKPRHWTEGGPVDAVALTRYLLDGIDVLNRRWQTDPRKNHPLMELSNQVIVTQLTVGEHPSSTAGRGEIIIDVQYLPHERDERGLGGHVKREVEAHLAHLAQGDPWLAAHPPRIEWILDADCAEVPLDHPVNEAFRGAFRALGKEAPFWGLGAHTDMGVPTERGDTPTVNFGPGSPSQAHQPNESVSTAELVQATTIMALVIADWCA